MRQYIRRGKYDTVLSFLEAPSFICEIAGLPFRRWKLIVGERNANPEITKSYKLRIYRWFHFFADYVATNSHSNLELVHSVCPLLPNSKGIVIYNAIDFNLWKPASNYTPRKDSKIRLILTARQTYVKNLNGLIEALALLSDSDRKKLKIEWYGDNITAPYFDNSFPEACKKIELYGLENIISFYPATLDIIRIIQEADAVGLFSFYEGLPNSICEAMACAKPVICSAVSDIPELLISDINLLCDPTENQSIKQAISYLINLSNDQLFKIGLNNETIAKNLFDKEPIISKYLSLQ